MHAKHLCLAAALAAGVALAAPIVNAQTLEDTIHERALAAADQGPDALRRFVDRPGRLYSLNYRDYAPRAPEAEIVASGPDTIAEFGRTTEDLSNLSSGPDAADELREQIYRDMQFE